MTCGWSMMAVQWGQSQLKSGEEKKTREEGGGRTHDPVDGGRLLVGLVDLEDDAQLVGRPPDEDDPLARALAAEGHLDRVHLAVNLDGEAGVAQVGLDVDALPAQLDSGGLVAAWSGRRRRVREAPGAG